MLIPNPKLKLADQCREVLRFKRYAYRTELTYLGWVERYVRFCRVEKSDAMERVPTGVADEVTRRRLARARVSASSRRRLQGANDANVFHFVPFILPPARSP